MSRKPTPIIPQKPLKSNMPEIADDLDDQDNDETGLTQAAIEAAGTSPVKPDPVRVVAPTDYKAIDTSRMSVAPKNNGVPRIRIVLEENDGIPPTGLFLSVNGNTYIIQPGSEVDVPPEVIGALNDAIMSVPVKDGGQKVTVYRNRLRFPYRVMGPVMGGSQRAA
jgi:hypothetical protein